MIIWHDGNVQNSDEAPEAALQRLADLVKHRRNQRRLSVRQAAEQAGIARNTWSAVEEGKRTHDKSHAGIEIALAWAPGSIAAIKSGGDPQESPPSEHRIAALPDNDALIRVMSSGLPPEKLAEISRTIIEEQERNKRRLIEMAEQLIAEAADGS